MRMTSRIVFGAGLLAFWLAAPVMADIGARFPYCQIVDRHADPFAGVEWSLTPSRRIEGGGRFGFAETRGWGEIYFFDTGRGEVSFSAETRWWVPTEGGPLNLPEILTYTRFPVRWDIRGYNGVTVRLLAEPGFYAEGAALLRGLDAPLTVTGIHSLTDRFSAFAGLHLRVRDDRIADPILGLRWSPFDPLILDFGYPVGRARLQVMEWGSIAAGYEVNRRYEFALPENDERERFSFRESRFWGGIAIRVAEDWSLELRGGRVAGRDFEFTSGGAGSKRLMEGSYFVAVAFTGTF